MRHRLFLLGFCLVLASVAIAQDPELSKDQMKQFLMNAKVIKSSHTKKGITDPWRLTLSDGTVTHEGVFQAIDEHKANMQFADGTTEINFVDSYKYNVAAYTVAEMLGLDDMVPMNVERKWQGNMGSISWVVPVKMDEEERLKKKIPAPNTEKWNQQMYKIRVLNQLVYDTDANLTNVLISPDWKIYRVDFSRAFRLSKEVKSYKDLVQCDRQLFDKLKAMTEADVTLKTKGFLTKTEVQAMMARRDKIVTYFQKMIADKGEKEILY